MICPSKSTVIVPELRRPTFAEFCISSIVSDGITSSSPLEIALPSDITVQVSTNHTPPEKTVPHVPESNEMIVAWASWTAKIENAKIKTANIGIKDKNFTSSFL